MVRAAACSLLLALPAVAAAQEVAPPPRAVTFGAWRTGDRKNQLLAAAGADPKAEAAVAAGLKWLAAQQKEDGTWSLAGGVEAYNSAGTGFALLAFLGGGHAPGDGGPYGKALSAGVAALLKSQDAKTGLVRCGGVTMYGHAISTLALVEAFGMSGDAGLKGRCQKAIDLIVKAQHPEGGWRYDPHPGSPGDVSVSGWVIQAMAAARLAGLDVPAETLDKANQFLDGCARGEKKGAFAYNREAKAVSPLTNSCTASAACSKLALGAWGPDSDGLAVAVGSVLKRAPGTDRDKDWPAGAYFLYYATRAAYCRGGDDWKAWQAALVGRLLPLQKADGGWAVGGGVYDRDLGPVGCTALHVLTLQTPYRYPPPR
ncbi:MAG: hypothetical protein C0501_29805 [Isosphaera sp.]|nr:hypothetical protein [Isosphaera sp.]